MERQLIYSSLTPAQLHALKHEEIKEIILIRNAQIQSGMTTGLAKAGYYLPDVVFQRALTNACISIAEKQGTTLKDHEKNEVQKIIQDKVLKAEKDAEIYKDLFLDSIEKTVKENTISKVQSCRKATFYITLMVLLCVVLFWIKWNITVDLHPKLLLPNIPLSSMDKSLLQSMILLDTI